MFNQVKVSVHEMLAAVLFLSLGSVLLNQYASQSTFFLVSNHYSVNDNVSRLASDLVMLPLESLMRIQLASDG